MVGGEGASVDLGQLVVMPGLRACLTIVCGLEGIVDQNNDLSAPPSASIATSPTERLATTVGVTTVEHISTMRTPQNETSQNVSSVTSRDTAATPTTIERLSTSTNKKPNILQSILKRLASASQASTSTSLVLSLLQTSWMKQWAVTTNSTLNEISLDISDLFIEAFFESQRVHIPQKPTIAPGSALVFTKERLASPLTKYPLYRLCNFIHAYVLTEPRFVVSFFPLYSLAFGVSKLETIMRRCRSVYVNTFSLVQEEKIRLLTFIYEELYKTEHFKELMVSFEFSSMDRFQLDSLASVFRFTGTSLEGLHLRSIEITDKPRLRWPRMLALLQQSIEKQQRLRRLSLHKCALTDEFLIDIAPAFRYLTHLDLSYNGLSQVSLNRILYCRETATVELTCFNFSWNQFNPQSTTDLREISPRREERTLINNESRDDWKVSTTGDDSMVTHCGEGLSAGKVGPVSTSDKSESSNAGQPENDSNGSATTNNGRRSGFSEESRNCTPNALVKVLDISQCQSSPMNVLEEVLVSNIIKTVQHLRIDRFTAVDQFLEVLSRLCHRHGNEACDGIEAAEGKWWRRSIALKSIHVLGLDGDDERFIDSYRSIRDQFEPFDVEVKLLDEETAEFLEIPDWFEMSFN